MRPGILILTLICLAGCASKPVAVTATTTALDSNRHDYDDATSAALVFDPPVTAGDPPLELSREERQPSAFVSFDGPTATYFWIHTDDVLDSVWNGNGYGSGGGNQDWYQRRAVMDKIGVTYR